MTMFSAKPFFALARRRGMRSTPGMLWAARMAFWGWRRKLTFNAIPTTRGEGKEAHRYMLGCVREQITSTST